MHEIFTSRLRQKLCAQDQELGGDSATILSSTYSFVTIGRNSTIPCLLLFEMFL